jgi:hypothetical protein
MAARRTIASTLAVLAVGIALLAGCTPADPNLQPTYSCTPDDGSSPYACPKVQYDAKAKEAALYAEAEAVYRKFFAEQERIYRAGGITEPSPVLLETTTGNYLAGSMIAFSDLVKYKGTATGGAFVLAWMKRVPYGSKNGAVTALQACVDSSSVTMRAEGEPPEPGKISSEIVYFTRDGQTLKAFDFQTVKVTQC